MASLKYHIRVFLFETPTYIAQPIYTPLLKYLLCNSTSRGKWFAPTKNFTSVRPRECERRIYKMWKTQTDQYRPHTRKKWSLQILSPAQTSTIAPGSSDPLPGAARPHPPHTLLGSLGSLGILGAARGAAAGGAGVQTQGEEHSEVREQEQEFHL